ncbi:hypothetical protein Bca52824_035416 [Brassica carinata]|uniref:Uncharacterized protein n=1 Tax=Brassica carinata TaxID=52824 RepID=A0A8X7S7I3_BRACI|nr:hypothetical protein Bca52824_035416 [Brassica carinata]
MVRLVRVYKGQWSKSQQSVWTLEQDQTEEPHDIMVSEHETNDGLRGLVRDLVCGQVMLCSDQVLHKVFTEEEMVLLYRFSFEIERSRNRVDLNVGAPEITGDLVVPQPIQPTRMEPRLGNANQMDHIERLLHTYEFDMYGFPSGAWMMSRHHSSVQGRWGGGFAPNDHHHYNATYLTAEERRPTYWENLMSSRYAVELQRIYGVPGSEHTGYPHTTLNIGSPNTPIGPPIIFLNDESSTASSGVGKTRGEFDGQGIICSGAGENSVRATKCIQGESSAMGAQLGNQPSATVIISPQNIEVNCNSAQHIDASGNAKASEETPVKVEE